jgi:large subunit ribosomal protein L18
MKLTRRKRIKFRVRSKVSGTPQRPRLSVYRSNLHIDCQLIDDENGLTLVYATSKDENIPEGGSKVEIAKKVGEILADKAKNANIKDVVFDRSGYRYHGRVKALAEGARQGGLNF